jgi:hypothetical protein
VSIKLQGISKPDGYRASYIGLERKLDRHIYIYLGELSRPTLKVVILNGPTEGKRRLKRFGPLGFELSQLHGVDFV